LLILPTSRLFWAVSREMFSGRSSESTTPLTKRRYSGSMSLAFY
jgi:hypothetical protein